MQGLESADDQQADTSAGRFGEVDEPGWRSSDLIEDFNMAQPGTKSSPRNPGEVDPSFGANGLIEIPEGDQVRAIMEDNDALIYAVWRGRETWLYRVFKDGAADHSFGEQGLVKWSFETGENASPEQLIRQPDGKFLLIGRSISNGDPFLWRAAVSRFHPNGSPDLIFGTRILPYPFDPDKVHMVVHLPVATLQADGKLLLATGYRVLDTQGYSLREAGRLHRFEADGAPDMTFGIQGQIEVRINGQDTSIEGIGVLTDGSIIVSATIDRGHDGFSNTKMALACLKSNGALSQGFAVSGYWEAERPTRTPRISIKNDQIMVMGIDLGEEGSHLWFSQLDANGKADPDFNNALPLLVQLPFATSFPMVVLQSETRVIGLVTGYDGAEWACLVGVQDDGSLDLGYGAQGIATLGPGYLRSGALQQTAQRVIVAADMGEFPGKKVPTVIGVLN